MNHLKKIFFIALIVSTNFICFSQRQKQLNYRKFDDKLIHFGFLLGGNTADFELIPVNGMYEKYNLTSLQNNSQPGAQIGIVTTLKLGSPLLRLRFLPSISFQERTIKYYYPQTDPNIKEDIQNIEKIHSTNIDFPLMLQFRTMRYNNFASYILGGMQYTYDLQSNENKNQSFSDPFVKIKASDWQGQAGIGVEFFAVYFKMGIELKYSHGLKNAIIHDFTPVSDPIQSLRNKIWSISIIFEG
jgi:hypothetical protein